MKTSGKPLFWIEARCDNLETPPIDDIGRSLCRETLPLGFCRLTSTARRSAIEQGWRISEKGEWLCPTCIESMEAGDGNQ